MVGDEIDLSELAELGDERPTETLAGITRGALTARRFRLTAVEGAASGLTWESVADQCAIGSHPTNDLVLEDSAVSRFHAEIRVDARGAWIRDLDSVNGTVVDGMRVMAAWLRPGCAIHVGRSVLRFSLVTDANRMALSDRTSFGALVGSSVPMRALFAQLERVAASDVTVLLEGETGTGKELAADAIHRESARRSRPLLVVDCSAIPANLLESELFGHEKGAYTGAAERRRGVFEEADGGTVFIDEIGELSPELQPKLLRVLERREVRRVGANTPQKIDVRVVAATNRDLRGEVNAGRFRSDLYFRLAVVRIGLPPLRERPEDLPLLVETILRGLGAGDRAPALLAPEFLDGLKRAAWPGNVRELRNHLERCLVFDDTFSPSEGYAESAGVDADLPYAEARRRAIDRFEHDYVERALQSAGGHAATAAQRAGINRVYLYRLMQRHRIKPGP